MIQRLTHSPRRQIALFWFLLLFCLFAVIGCQTSGYEQEAGLKSTWPDRAETGTAAEEPHGANIIYEFEDGQVTRIEVNITNATDVALLDTSLLKSKSAVSKSSVGAAGSRDGMLSNITKIEGKADTEARLDAVIKSLASLAKELGKAKAPIALPDLK
jgi:hypothetical protein